MDQRSKFIIEVTSGAASLTDVCRRFGITRQTGYKWWRRWKDERSVEELSPRPKSHPATTSRDVEKRIVSQRRRFPRLGPVPLRKRLQVLWPRIDWPTTSTIGDLLEREGLVGPNRIRR